MKSLSIFILTAFLVMGGSTLSAQKEKTNVKKPKSKAALKNTKDSLSYCIGTAVMKNISDQGITDLNMKMVVLGMEDVKNKISVVDADAANQYVNDYFYKQYALKAEKDKAGQLNWLVENKTKEGVKTTASGLQYKILSAGTGPIAKELSTVKVHYEGKLIDGKVFDSSYERGEPIEFGVSGVIKGWTEALLMMPQGSKWELYIPYDLAYGDKGAGGTIPPYATLIFVVELLEVK